MNTKDRRIQDCKKQSNASKLPSSYKVNSIKEELCFEYITSFIQQFRSLYPKRRLPYMIAMNECGVKKFVCSTLRPTQLPFSELYDMYECASFLSGYILYEPLSSFTEPPQTLFSPSQTLSSHIGDCFDNSTLLCSFLLGAGYDAYVVYGHAPAFIALRDQSMTVCPLIAGHGDTQIESNQSEASSNNSNASSSDENNANNYIPVDNSVKDSAFLRQQQESRVTAAMDTFELWVQDRLPSQSQESKVEEDASANSSRRLKGGNAGAGSSKCIHAWVLVVAGKRDVKEHVLLEPSTGRAYSVINSPFVSIEGLWNNVNYWVNLNPEKKISEVS